MERVVASKEILMPAWLCTKETFVPRKDNERFIDRTIMSLGSLLTRLISSGKISKERRGVLPELRMISLLLVVTLISLSRGFGFVGAVTTVLLVILASLSAEEIVHVFKVTLAASLFSFLVLLPSAPFYGFHPCLMITSKVFASVMAASLLSVTTGWDSITRSLRIFPIPDIFILVLDISLRYIVLLGELAHDMFWALKLRSVGRNPDKQHAVAGIAGNIFLISKIMADDMYASMRCRGFTGEYRLRRRWRVGFADVIFIAVNAGMVFLFIVMYTG
jgi:cobalt/nickel transport system permease protein